MASYAMRTHVPCILVVSGANPGATPLPAPTHQAVLVLLSLFQGFRDLSLAGEAPAHPFGLGSQLLCS